VKLNWMYLAFVFAFVAAGFAIAGLVLLRKFGQAVAENRRQIASLTELVWALEASLAELNSAPAAPALGPAPPEKDSIPSEIQAVIAAAAVTLFGHKVRLSSARLLSPQAGVSRWSQQGRVIVQTSHNLRPRR
jgi:hypothetical protein